MDIEKLTSIGVGSQRVDGPFRYWSEDLTGTKSNWVHRLHGLVTKDGVLIPIHAITGWRFEDLPKHAIPEQGSS